MLKKESLKSVIFSFKKLEKGKHINYKEIRKRK